MNDDTQEEIARNLEAAANQLANHSAFQLLGLLAATSIELGRRIGPSAAQDELFDLARSLFDAPRQ